MAEVVVYTKESCAYCFRVKSLLDARGVSYREIDLEEDPAREEGDDQAFGRTDGGSSDLHQRCPHRRVR